MNRDLIYNYYNSKVDSSRNTFFHTPEKNNNNDSMKLECNCNRSPETIKCRHCEMTFIGRKRTCCRIHQNTIHLMDFMFCPSCKKIL